MAILAHCLCDACAELLPFDAPFLIADAPQNHRRVIPVSFDHSLQKAYVLFVDSCQAVLLDDQNAETVTCVKHLRSHRIVARTVCVASELLQLEEPPLLEPVRNAASDSCMILMHVHTLEFHRLSVEEESAVRVEGYMPDACHGLIGINNLSSGRNFCHYGIEIRILAAPQVRILHRNYSCGDMGCLGLDDHSACIGGTCHIPVSILQNVPYGVS